MWFHFPKMQESAFLIAMDSMYIFITLKSLTDFDFDFHLLVPGCMEISL